MIFSDDTRSSLWMTADLVNTLPGTADDAVDSLVSVAELTAYLQQHPYSGRIRADQAELDDIRSIRPRLRALWDADRDAAVPLVNAMLADGRALPRLVRHDAYDWHIHATDDDAPLATRMLVEAAMAVLDVIRSDQYDRMRVCEADDCGAVYVDYSRNGSKRYCDTGNCGNRMNVNAYRRRKAQETA
ncbi:CGNR zinc finger domain-containing protein [Microbacterium sp. NPDC089189]|uniref:CGNR zinc finger domain-containing protein n=1 Tax=Microbacterium sp. NPDC089189 TaxID=3154972 RepID=UPI00342BE99C